MLTIGMILFDNLTQLDLTAPFEVLSRMPNAKVELIAEKKNPSKATAACLFCRQ